MKLVSLLEKSNGIKIMSERMHSLEDSIKKFSKIRDAHLAEISDLQKKVAGYKEMIDDMADEVSIIKQNWQILIKSSDPLSKTRIMFRRCNRRCTICNKILFSKKDLKVHKFKAHGY